MRSRLFGLGRGVGACFVGPATAAGRVFSFFSRAAETYTLEQQNRKATIFRFLHGYFRTPVTTDQANPTENPGRQNRKQYLEIHGTCTPPGRLGDVANSVNFQVLLWRGFNHRCACGLGNAALRRQRVASRATLDVVARGRQRWAKDCRGKGRHFHEILGRVLLRGLLFAFCRPSAFVS